MNSLFDILVTVNPLLWQRTLERPRMIIALFQKLQLIILDRLNKEFCIASYLMAKQIVRLGRKSGWLFVSLYLKQCSATLQLFRGSDNPVPRVLSVPVSLTGSGLPRIIPTFHRKAILRRDAKADIVIKFYLSVFSINRIIPLAKRVNKKTFSSITTPVKDMNSVQHVVSDLKLCLTDLLFRYIPQVRSYPLEQGMTFEPTWAALPTSKIVQSMLLNRLKHPWSEVRGIKSCFLSLPYELACWMSLVTFTHAKGEQSSQGSLWPKRTRFAFDKNNKVFSGLDLEWFEKCTGPYLPTCTDLGIPPITGRLSCTFPGAGKRRIFAIGNYVNQRLLRPVHDWVMFILRNLETDGTYNQHAPLHRLKGHMKCFSYDLSSATDRWPLLIMFETFQTLFDRSFASAVVNSCLATNIFQVPFVKRKLSSVCFVAGQPLGYYSSWALFSLTHHLLVWLSAERVYPGKKFTSYAVLGDDILIADDRVAPIYASYVERLGVEISYLKSISSTTGCIEFAKKFLVNGMTSDLSPVSCRALCNYFHPYGAYAIHMKYGLKRFSTFCRIGGTGYKALSTLSNISKCSRSVQRKHAMFTRASKLPLDWWFGRGKPLNPYVRGRLVSYLLNQMRPRDLNLAPSKYFEMPGMNDFLEWSLLHRWMKSWLKYLKWYCEVSSNPEVTLYQLLEEAPVVTDSWKVRTVNEKLIRFGRLWKCYDLIGSYGETLNNFVLPPTFDGSPPRHMLLGGHDGRSFLVDAQGLEHPLAHRGVLTYTSSLSKDKTLGVAERQVTVGYYRLVNGLLVVC